MITTKGSAWNCHLNYFTKRFSEAQVSAVKEKILPENRSLLFDKPIVAISRVSLDAVMDFLRTADQVLGNGDKQLLRDCLHAKAQSEIKGVFKIFFSILSPEAVIKKAANVWKYIYQQGKIDVVRKHKRIEFKVSQFDEMPKDHDFTVAAYIEETLKMCNCKNPRARIIKTYMRGDDHCLFEFTWE